MKISNELKIGAIAIAATTILILGFNFLKGKKYFSDDLLLVAKYNNVQGLQPSNPVTINGMQVGTVYKIIPDKYMREINVELNISKDINIPLNSIALIRQNPLGTSSVDIKLGDTSVYLKNKDTILTEASTGLFTEALKKIDPVLFEVRKAVTTLDTLVGNINNTLDPNTKGNLQGTISNLNTITASLIYSTASLQKMLDQQNGALAKSMNNINAITGNIASQNERINSIIANLNKTTTNFSELDLQKTLTKLDQSASDLKTVMAKINNGNGSLGMLMNDTRLYNNLASTGNKLNLLIDDIRMNPKRYINISVFGKKQTVQPIMVPLPDTIHAPYYVDKVKIDSDSSIKIKVEK